MARFRDRLGISGTGPEGLPERVDRTVMARALMYLLAAVGGAILVSTAVPDAPLAGSNDVAVLAAIAFALATGLLIGFDRLPTWGYHALLLCATALITWAVQADGDGRSPYAILYLWIVIYASFFFGPRAAALHVVAVLAAYGGVVIARQENTQDPALQWAMVASGMVLAAGLIQSLNARIDRMVGRLQEGSRSDSLTGLYNEAGFNELLDNEVERARRSGNRLAIVIAELDNFGDSDRGKSLSQDQGQLLSAVGKIFSSSPRQIDMAARLEGGRFAAVLPYTDEHGGQIMAERMRGLVAQLPDAPGARISIGVASFPRHGAEGQWVYQAAQAALEEAQAAGGDRVVMHQRPQASIESRSASVTIDEVQPSRRDDDDYRPLPPA
jgi:diguanylate cyclase (GGDEF)-like protein